MTFNSCFKNEGDENITVVFLHGLLRTSAVMRKLASHVTAETGWQSVCLDYPSHALPLQALAEGLVDEIKASAGEGGRVFAVTHSMGGIVLRHIMGLKDQGGVCWVGCIMLAPPSQGSTVARIMSKAWGVRTVYGAIYGSAGLQLGQEVAQNSNWPDPPRPCAVIAGNKHFGAFAPVSWLTSTLHMLHGANDGTVTVEETKLPAMCAHATVPATHAALIDHQQTARLVLTFLKTGSFD